MQRDECCGAASQGALIWVDKPGWAQGVIVPEAGHRLEAEQSEALGAQGLECCDLFIAQDDL